MSDQPAREAGSGEQPAREAGSGEQPAREAGSAEQPAREAGPGRRPARCNVCGDVVESRHPWDVQRCSCGRLTLSGGPKHRRVHWRAEPGAGWTDLDEALAEDENAGDEAGTN